MATFTRQIFISLPVRDLAVSVAFYEALGFKANPDFSDPTGACIVISSEIYVMLLTHAKWAEFSSLPIVDATKALEVAHILSCSSREEVDAFLFKAKTAGATFPRPAMDLGFMYQVGIADPDGHIWKWMYMDMSKFPGK